MSEFAALPIILVSAKSEAAASHFISELIDNEPPELTSGGGSGRVWRIVNKYYSADVRLLPLADSASPPASSAPAEGHVIYLADDECTVEAGERRLSAGAGAAVRVLACEAPRLPAALRDWAARRRLEPVALRPAPGDGDGDSEDDEPSGAAAARAALHAHVWPGLRPLPRPLSEREDEDEDEDAEWSDRTERWATALGRLDGVRALPPPERRAAAEALVAAFCHALGHDLETL